LKQLEYRSCEVSSVSDPVRQHLIVTGFEGAEVDGALLCGTDEELETFGRRFRPDDSYAKWKWAMQEKSARFITFDVKYVSLRALRTQMQDYSFTEVTRSHHTAKAEIYMLCFEGVPDYIAIVPKLVWEKATTLTHGMDPLISKIPAWCFVFMVHDNDLEAAIFQLIAASTCEDAHVANPTVGVILTGYRPKTTKEKPFLPTAGGYARARLSYDALTWLLETLDESDPMLRVHLNPLAPLICDFLLEIPGIREAVTIEAKISLPLAELETVHFETGERRSPFASFRQWHFLVVQAEAGENTFLCIGRHEVQEEWVSDGTWKHQDYRRFLIQGEHAVGKLIDYMSQNYSKASRRVTEITASAAEHNVELESLVTSNAADRMDDLETPTKSMNLVFHQPGLPGVAQLLNEQCRREGRGICFALDAGHPVSTHTMVDWIWTNRQGEDYDLEGTLPILPFSKDAMERPCVPLDLIDLSGAHEGFPLGMREYYWTLPALKQHFITIGSTMKASDLLSITRFSPSVYLMFPSQFLARMRAEPRKAVSARIGYNGEGYFFRVTQGENAANPEIWNGHRTNVELLKKGSRLLDPDSSEVNPLEYLVDLHDGSMLSQILELFDGDGEMRIKGFQSVVPNHAISKPLYRTTLKALHQAAWDYGGKFSSTRYCSCEQHVDNPDTVKRKPNSLLE
jgi:hypothetical protein